MMSKSVPPTTNKAITTMYVCMTVGDTDAESSANGLLMNMVESLDACLEGKSLTGRVFNLALL
jgi:hypothetical protein